MGRQRARGERMIDGHAGARRRAHVVHERHAVEERRREPERELHNRRVEVRAGERACEACARGGARRRRNTNAGVPPASDGRRALAARTRRPAQQHPRTHHKLLLLLRSPYHSFFTRILSIICLVFAFEPCASRLQRPPRGITPPRAPAPAPHARPRAAHAPPPAAHHGPLNMPCFVKISIL